MDREVFLGILGVVVALPEKVKPGNSSNQEIII